MNFFPQRLLGLALIVSCFLDTTIDGQEVRRAIPVNPPISQTPVQGVAPYGPPSTSPVVGPPASQPTGPSPAAGATSAGQPAPQIIPPPGPSGPASIDDTARFLAGLPVSEGSPLGPLERTAVWQQHATFFDEAWAKLAARQLTGIREWEVNYLPDATQPLPVMFYMFSGPDFLYANQFFPNADTYILAGTEPIGPLPDVLRFAGPALEPVLQNLQKSLNSVLNFSFFITKEMKTNLQIEQLKGTLPIFYVFLARAGKTITEINLITLDKNAQVSQSLPNAKAKSLTPGVRITFTGPSGTPRQTLYYFTTDLSNEGIRSQPGFLKFCAAHGMGASLLKSASYLMFENGFTRIKEFLLNQSRAIVQDDSGIPVSAFDPARWSLRFFGSYAGPIDLFKQYYQPQLQGLYQQSNPVPLPFGIGYRWAPRQSTLIVATLKGTEVLPLQTLPVAPSTPSRQR